MAGKRRVVVEMTPAMVEQTIAGIDWAKVDATDDADIAAQIAADPDTAPVLSDVEHIASQVKLVRHRLSLTQAEFARRFQVSLGTVRDWEQGRRQPDGPAQVLLWVIDREPEAVLRALASRHAA
ncbi:MAG: helix-turn-helix domain-containing protein [Alphaproteobacteria bacterium]|nr:helix-turn-helix domain-containing protein [Alphaproteobacteria bacterium]